MKKDYGKEDGKNRLVNTGLVEIAVQTSTHKRTMNVTAHSK